MQMCGRVWLERGREGGMDANVLDGVRGKEMQDLDWQLK